jgi:hypothetical protein
MDSILRMREMENMKYENHYDLMRFEDILHERPERNYAPRPSLID